MAVDGRVPDIQPDYGQRIAAAAWMAATSRRARGPGHDRKRRVAGSGTSRALGVAVRPDGPKYDAPMILELAAATSRRLPAFRGKAQIAQRMMRWQRGSDDTAWLVTRRNGDRIVLPPRWMMCWQMAFTGVWDDSTIAHVQRYVRPGSVALDIGAAIGLWTVPLARAARTVGATVVAIEPLPANARWLHTNLALNGVLDEVVVHKVALGSSTGMARLESAEMAGGSAALAVVDGPPLAADGVDVLVRRLDDLALPGPVSFMKLDVEGHECQVLDGASAVIETDRPVILGEFSPAFLELRGETMGHSLDRLFELGYQAASVEVVRTRPWRARGEVLIRRLAARSDPKLLRGGDLLFTPQR